MIGQAALRDIPAAYIIDKAGTVKLAVLEDERIPYVRPPQGLIREANKGHVPLLMPTKTEGLDDANIPYQELPAYLERDAQRGRVAALIKLKGYDELLSLRRPRRRPRRWCSNLRNLKEVAWRPTSSSRAHAAARCWRTGSCIS